MSNLFSFILDYPFFVGFGVPFGILLIVMGWGALRKLRISTGWMMPGAGVWSWLWRVFENTKEEIAIIAALAFLTLVLHRVGYASWDLLYYLPGIFVLSLVTKWVMKGRRFVPLTMAIVAFLILGFSHPWPADPTKSVWTATKEWWNKEPPKKELTGPPAASRVTVTQQCPGDHRSIDLGPIPQVINPGARCILDFTVAQGPVELSGPTGSVMVGTRQRVHLPTMWFESARAVNKSAKLLYRLVSN